MWAATWNFGDPFGSAHPDQVLRAVQHLSLPAVREPVLRTPQQVHFALPGDRLVCTPADAARALGRALTSAERTTTLLDTADARARTEIALRRLRTYVGALDTIRKVRHPECTTATPTPS
ncbi:hypothetical protein BJF90_07895 [Pseudonocardia sp. CNS-004]|nr:hypothetical protein BJF90_07895 [Pseudonocardia sp. CNS-004]